MDSCRKSVWFSEPFHHAQVGFRTMAEEREASVQLLKAFAPLDGLKRDNIAALAKKVSVRTMPAGRVLFKEGDTEKRTVWVVAGMVELQEGSRTVAMIRGDTPESRNPLSSQIPRKQ